MSFYKSSCSVSLPGVSQKHLLRVEQTTNRRWRVFFVLFDMKRLVDAAPAHGMAQIRLAGAY